MARNQKQPGKATRTGAFVIGRSFAKISEVEGIRLNGEMKIRATEAARTGSSLEEYRQTIVRSHRKK